MFPLGVKSVKSVRSLNESEELLGINKVGR